MDARLRGLIGLVALLASGAGAIAQSLDGQTVADVSVRGNRFITSESILAKTRTRKDRPYSQADLQSDVSTLMATRQFSRVTPFVQPAAGNQVQVVLEVTEYPNVVQEIRYDGAKHLKDDELNSLTGLKRGVPLNPIANKLAVNAILRKLHEQGRLYASVELVEGGNPGDTRVVFRITEGRVVKVGKVSFEGNSFVSGERLRTQIQTSRTLVGVGGDYNPAMIDFDVAHLEEYYRTYGYQDVRVSRELIYDGPDRVHLIFHIAEGPRYRVSQLQFNGGGGAIEPERLKALTQLKPGDVYDKNVVTADLKNIRAVYGYQGRLVNPKEEVYQTGPGEVSVQYTFQERPPATVGEVIIIGNTVTRDNVIRRQVPLRPGQILTYPDLQVAEANLARLGIFEADPEKGQRPTVSVIDPDGDNPIKNILVQVQEAPTGSFLLGVGVNSDAGVSGSIVLNERNFDIWRWPTSFDELLSGQAFRGAGQEFRLEAVPGNRFQRYTASFREPSLFDTQFSLGNSFYFYTRGFSEYNEQRLGGRTVLGRRIADTYWSATASARLESVDVFDVPFYAPQSILEDTGTTFLAGVRGAAQYDSRDSFLRPAAGMQLEMGYEQVFGTYTYPLSVEGSRYFTVYQRPDGSGKHIIALRSQAYFTNSEAPVYERFYAGGFRSLRGFSFRGVGPFEDGFNVGGQFSFLNSVEYQVPILASDKLFGVVFCDTGTVEPTIAINDYRVAAGFGFRIQVPMFGPVPIALDFGFPIVKADSDQKQMFNFWLGFFN